MKHISHLHVITQELPGISHAALAEKACKAGVKWIQFRDKTADEKRLLNRMNEVKEVCKKYNALFIVNDHVMLAKKVVSDGIHLGRNDMDVTSARNILGDHFIIGGTANTADHIYDLNRVKADYIGLGPYRFTSTKENLSPVLGFKGYQELVHLSKAPVIAIGGINMEDLDLLSTTSIHGIAVASTVNLSSDPSAFIQKVNLVFVK